ncbi:hypothetical protein OV090_47945 [Nannocystis sp. RBIL2]|uniref:hypothetical protein n=1 Tax=Nannocystis sp. RBIL2 TaxID=2996788 RepID=UPI00226D45BB|nr:hypothetical protein [Nannocystis sp. RBIL2]MCY1072572.1 hypothetical protein [Nannocystis sp. RBIL2]
MVGTESDSWHIDQAMREYQARSAGELDLFIGSTEAPGGAIEYCGTESDQANWTAAYVRAEDEALLPLAVGSFARVIEQVTRIDRMDTPIWDPRLMPPPVVVLDGARRHFRPAHGRHLLGVVETRRRAVLLATVGEALAVVHVAGKRRTVLFRGGPFSFRELDVDALLQTRRDVRTGAAEPKQEASAIRPPSSVRAHHARIVGKLRVDVGEGPTMDEVLWFGFEDLARRAMSVTLGAKRKRKGKTMVSSVVRAIHGAVSVGCGNFQGVASELLEQLKALCPDLEISVEVFGDVLRLLHATGTCLLEQPSSRTWRLRLVGLTDPRSSLHRRFCEETVGLCRLDEAAPARAPKGSLALSARSPQPPIHEGDAQRAARPRVAGMEPTDEPAQKADPTRAADPAPTADVRPELGVGPVHEALQADLSPAAEPVQQPRADLEVNAGPAAELPLPAPAQVACHAQAVPAEFDLPEMSAPAAAVVAMFLGMKEKLRAAAMARAILLVEREELRAQLAVAEAQRARLAVEIPRAETPPPNPNPASAVPQPTMQVPRPSPARRRRLPLRVMERLMPPVELRAWTPLDEAQARWLTIEELHPESPPVLRAPFEVVGFLAWPRWFPLTRPSLGGLPIAMDAERDHDGRGRHDWSAGDLTLCTASATPIGPLALGSLGARGPPGPWRCVPSRATTSGSSRRRAESGAAGLVVRLGRWPPSAIGLRENKRLQYKGVMPQIILENYNLEAAERRLCVDALEIAGNIVGAAQLLGITRHSMKRRIVKLRIDWARPSGPHAVAPSTSPTA